MGGLFRAPKPPAPHVATQPAPRPNSAGTAAAASAAGGGDEDRARRLATLEARRLGRASTVATSWRGVLAESLPAVGRKSLLGE